MHLAPLLAKSQLLYKQHLLVEDKKKGNATMVADHGCYDSTEGTAATLTSGSQTVLQVKRTAARTSGRSHLLQQHLSL